MKKPYAFITAALLLMTLMQFSAAANHTSLPLYAFFLLLSAILPLLILLPVRKRMGVCKEKTNAPLRDFFLVLPLFFFLTMALAIPASYLTEGNAIEATRENLPRLLLCSVLLAALCEEAVFRFAILPLLAKQHKAAGLLLSAGLFALAHTSFGSMLYAFPAGLILGAVMLRFASPLPAFILHLLNNLLSVSLAYAPCGNLLYLFLLLFFLLASLPCLRALHKKRVLPRLLRALSAPACRAAILDSLRSSLALPILLWLFLTLIFIL